MRQSNLVSSCRLGSVKLRVGLGSMVLSLIDPDLGLDLDLGLDFDLELTLSGRRIKDGDRNT